MPYNGRISYYGAWIEQQVNESYLLCIVVTVQLGVDHGENKCYLSRSIQVVVKLHLIRFLTYFYNFMLLMK